MNNTIVFNVRGNEVPVLIDHEDQLVVDRAVSFIKHNSEFLHHGDTINSLYRKWATFERYCNRHSENWNYFKISEPINIDTLQHIMSTLYDIDLSVQHLCLNPKDLQKMELHYTVNNVTYFAKYDILHINTKQLKKSMVSVYEMGIYKA